MLSILIVIFSLKFIEYFIHNINYNKNTNISKTNNNILNWFHNTRPIDLGS